MVVSFAHIQAEVGTNEAARHQGSRVSWSPSKLRSFFFTSRSFLVQTTERIAKLITPDHTSESAY
jgi:hypothetical protein